MANILTERNRFYQRCLEKGETFDQFLNDLYRLAENCEFDSQRDQMIRDRIVFGISNYDLQMELLKLGGNPMLNDIVAMCRLSLNTKLSTEFYVNSAPSVYDDTNLWENNYIFSDEDIISLTDKLLEEMENYSAKDDLDDLNFDLDADFLPDLNSIPDPNELTDFPSNECDTSICSGDAKGQTNAFPYEEQNVVIPINNFINTIFFCIVCNVAFTTETDLENHNNDFHAAVAPLINSEIRHCIQREMELLEQKKAEKLIVVPKFISADKKAIQCEKCRKIFTEITNFKLHTTEHPECYVKQYFCTVCHDAFASIHDLRLHLELHTKDTLFQCNQCNKPFTTAQYLKFHIVSQHQKPFKCGLCKMTFGYRHYLSAHLDTKHDGHGRECKCTICTSHFQSIRRPRKHPTKMTNKDSETMICQKCSVCKKEFPNLKDLETHSILKHQRQYCCYICHQNYDTFFQVKRHLRYHNERKQLLCNKCGKQIKGKQAFKIHLRIHSGERPFFCEVCTRSFTRQSDLSSHMFTHNENMKAHQCNLCGKQFAKPYQIKIHMMVHRDERPYHCDVCNKKFRFWDKLKGHIRTHNGIKPYACAICSEYFHKKSIFDLHMQQHTA